jgi:hypothetical protein
MPTEPVVLTHGDGTEFEQLAYLAECRSWGGHSGSPAFCLFRLTEDGQPLNHIGFLGLVSAHYDIPTEVRSEMTGEVFRAAVNSGIAIVTPAEFVRDLLFRDDLVEERNHHRGVRGPGL